MVTSLRRGRGQLVAQQARGRDLITKSRLLSEIQALATEHRFTIVLITHDPLEATTLCQSAVVLNGGRMEAAGTLDELLRTPKSEILKAFRAQLQPDG